MNIIKELEKYLLTEIIIDQGIEKESIAPDEDILSQGIIDSLGILKLSDFIEKTFEIKIIDEDMDPENFRDLSRLKEFIESKQQIGKS
jgi:acyl carrier protein